MSLQPPNSDNQFKVFSVSTDFPKIYAGIQRTQFLTVYLTAQGIEVCPGCKDYPDWYALHTSKSYESAEQFAQAVAIYRSLPIRNWLRPEG